VQAQFDGIAPALTDLVVPYQGSELVSLLFDTSRVPFVVRNPAFGHQSGEAVALEVLWREGTRTRSGTATPDLRAFRRIVAHRPHLVPVMESSAIGARRERARPPGDGRSRWEALVTDCQR
jgi:hypothetical protein